MVSRMLRKKQGEEVNNLLPGTLVENHLGCSTSLLLNNKGESVNCASCDTTFGQTKTFFNCGTKNEALPYIPQIKVYKYYPLSVTLSCFAYCERDRVVTPACQFAVTPLCFLLTYPTYPIKNSPNQLNMNSYNNLLCLAIKGCTRCVLTYWTLVRLLLRKPQIYLNHRSRSLKHTISHSLVLNKNMWA